MALIRQIQTLEAELRDNFLRRHGRGVSLTPNVRNRQDAQPNVDRLLAITARGTLPSLEAIAAGR